MPHSPFSRRHILLGAATLTVWARLPRFAHAAERDPRLIVLVLRGALDGLAVVPPVGDPTYAALRGPLAVPTEGAGAALPLDGHFALNAAMPKFHGLYHSGEAMLVHAVATPYRDRSHFDGQDVLESGHAGPGATLDGWLNRAAAALPAGDRVAAQGGLAVGPMVPLILRGPAPVMNWSPAVLPEVAPDTVARLQELYDHSDEQLARALRTAAAADRMTMGDAPPKGKGGGLPRAFIAAAEGAGRLLARPDGPRLAALSFDGWDTHAGEGPNGGRLSSLLGGLDVAVDALRTTLGPAWRDTVVVAATEFGRTAAANGTEGTDHGTGTVAFLAGGAVKGGRVIADWPGLGPAALYQQRDLAPTTDLRSILKGVLADHLGLSEKVLAETVFPESAPTKPVKDLLA
ncbi:MAG TPA: DUF1501 domain-containing protein [Xanthobacteraceae bacterium]|nr:DUF1501 domain-containing protein [Xanthobacteraceae bacterium]